MHATIGARMTAVEAVLKVLQEENLAKEECARKALAEQEALMEKVLEESRILEREAKENAKVTNLSCRGRSQKSSFLNI